MACILNGTGGLMLAVVCFELLPEAYAFSWPYALAGLALGVTALLAADQAMARRMRGNAMLHTGRMLLLSIILHNLPEGIATGAAFASDMRLGLMLTLVILLHDLPEGMTMALNLRMGGARGIKVALAVCLICLSTALGAWTGVSIAGLSPELDALGLGLAGGAMLTVVVFELLPRAGALSEGRMQTLMLVSGLALGSLMTLHM